MRITLVRDDGKVKTLRTLKMELLLEQMKTEVKAQPVSKMREVLRYTLPGNSIEEVRKVPKVMPAAAFVRKEGVMTLNEYNGIVMMEVNNLSGRAEADEIKELVKELPQTYLAFTGSSGKSVKIWVRFTYPDDRLPTLREQAELFHAHAYQTAVKYYQPQLPFDIELKESISSAEAVSRLNAVMVEGIEVLSFRQIAEEKKMTGMAIVAAADYLLDLVPGTLPDDWETQMDAFLAQSEIRILKQTKRSEKEVDIKPLIYRMEVQDHKLFMQLAAGSVENLKPGLVMEAFCRFLDADATQLKFALCRLEMYADSGDENARNLVTLESLGTVIE